MAVASAIALPDVATSPRTIVGASTAGASHVRRGVPCQDAFCVLERGGAFAIAVADGLGSAPRSDLGADLATVAAATRALEFADDDPVVAALEGMIAARDALEAGADERSLPLRDLGCTLLIATGNVEQTGIAHIGDGAVVGRAAGAWHVLSPPAASEYVNETDPITGPDWERNVRCVCVLGGVDALALFTDGCQHAGLRSDGVRVYAHGAFFDPLAGFVTGGVGDLDATIALRNLLAGRKLAEHSDDDKTLVIAVL